MGAGADCCLSFDFCEVASFVDFAFGCALVCDAVPRGGPCYTSSPVDFGAVCVVGLEGVVRASCGHLGVLYAQVQEVVGSWVEICGVVGVGREGCYVGEGWREIL